MTTTEQAINGLATWLQSSGVIQANFSSGVPTDTTTMGRRIKAYDKCGDYPALFLVHLSDDDDYSGEGQLDRSEITVQAWIYATPKTDQVPDTVLNELCTALGEAMQPFDPGSGNFTIGGLVTHCRIEGRTEYYPGDDTSKYATAVVSIKILLTQ